MWVRLLFYKQDFSLEMHAVDPLTITEIWHGLRETEREKKRKRTVSSVAVSQGTFSKLCFILTRQAVASQSC